MVAGKGRKTNKMTDLIKLRKKIKDKKPDFVRQSAYKLPRLSKSGWRAPKGGQSKMRRKFKGKRKQPSVGYRSPKKIRGFTREGFKPILVKNLKDLEKIKENEITIIAKTVGLRKKIQLLEKIKEKKLKVANVKNIEKFLSKIKKQIEERKTKRKEVKKAKETKEKEKAKKKPEKKEETPEEKEKREKEEKRKVLEQK